MKSIIMIVKRNLKVFSGNKMAVFFSLLASVIVVFLNITFLGSSNLEELIEISQTDLSSAKYFIVAWLMAGIFIINTITVSLSLMGLMVQDKEKNIFQAFLVSPIKRVHLALAYIITAIISSIMIDLAFLVFLLIYLYSGGYILDILTILKIIGIILLSSFSSSAFMFFIINCIQTVSAYQGLNILISTLSGFITGIYVVIGSLPEYFQNILKCIPAMQITAMMRKICTEEIMNSIFINLPSKKQSYAEYMGIILSYNGKEISYGFEIFISIASSLIFISLAALLLKHKENADR